MIAIELCISICDSNYSLALYDTICGFHSILNAAAAAMCPM